MRSALERWLCVVVVVVGCAPSGQSPDAGSNAAVVADGSVGGLDAGFSDAGFSDAGFSDAGFSDAGFSDAGFSDA
ncbi:MAG: hypothetical protein GQE15_25310, partial [Archangiaceae bacterium]|nr:hypothetical protein [Archangiaceae bacterium]